MAPPKKKDYVLCVFFFLALGSVVAYWQVVGHGFVNYDDGPYVTENSYVQSGLTWEAMSWAFTT